MRREIMCAFAVASLSLTCRNNKEVYLLAVQLGRAALAYEVEGLCDALLGRVVLEELHDGRKEGYGHGDGVVFSKLR